MDREPYLSIIVPNHNEERIFEVLGWCKDLYPKAEIILSTDIEGIGKGWAIRQGLKRATGQMVAFIDGDMDIHPIELKKLFKKATNKYDIVVGKKSLKSLPFRRKWLTFLSRKISKWLFHLPITDTQTGIKVFRRQAIVVSSIKGFAFDVEMLVNAHRIGMRIGEVPVKCHITGNKNFKTIAQTFWDMLMIKRK